MDGSFTDVWFCRFDGKFTVALPIERPIREELTAPYNGNHYIFTFKEA